MKSCKKGYKMKDGKCKKETKRDIIFDTTKRFRVQAMNILVVSLIAVFSWLIFDGLVGIFKLQNMSNLLKIIVGVFAVILITYLARNKLRLKV